MKIDDYSSLESYSKGLFDGYMGKAITPEQATLEDTVMSSNYCDYLKGYHRAVFTLQTQPLDIKVIK
jgi:hypothetical protein